MERQNRGLLIGVLTLCGLLWVGLIIIGGMMVHRNAKGISAALKTLWEANTAETEIAAVPPPVPPLSAGRDIRRVLKPIGDPAGWFPITSYPMEAIRAEEQGRAVLALKIGPDGKALACETITGSGSVWLDDVTCRQFKARARFEPIRDTDGAPVEGWGRALPVRWVLPK